MNKKVFYTILLVIVFLLSACQPAAPATEAPQAEVAATEAPKAEAAATEAPAAEATAPEAPAEEMEKNLIVAIPGEIESLDVHQLQAPRSWSVAFALYGMGFNWGYETDAATGLTYANTDYTPGLIESWEKRTEGDQVVYTLKVRQGCKFESGNELTSKDFQYRTERMQALRPWNNTVWGCTKGKDCIKIIDDYTFEYWIDAPNPLTDVGMRELNMMIVDSELLKTKATTEDPWAHEYLRLNGLGIGAYRIESSTPGVEMVLAKNEDYCAPENMHGYFDKIILKVIPDASQQKLLLEKGEIDIAPELPAKEMLDLKDKPGLNLLGFNSSRGIFLGLNNTIEPYNNTAVRQALAYAVPYQDILDAVFFGQAQPAAGLITSGTVGGSDIGWVYEYDPEKAKQMLADAGYPDGFDMDLVIDMSQAEWEEAAVLIQDSFSKIGVNVNIVKESSAAYQEKLKKKELPAFIYHMLSWTNDVGYSFDMIWSPWGFGDYPNYDNKDLQAQVKEAWTEMDPDVRFPMYPPMIETLNTDVPAIVIVQPNNLVSMRSNLEGYVKYDDELPRYYEMKRVEE